MFEKPPSVLPSREVLVYESRHEHITKTRLTGSWSANILRDPCPPAAPAIPNSLAPRNSSVIDGRGSSPAPRKLSKEEAKKIRQLGTTVLHAIHHVRACDLTLVSPGGDSTGPPDYGEGRKRRHTRYEGRCWSRYRQREGMSTLPEVSETASAA